MLQLSTPLTLKLAAGEMLAWHQGGVTLRVLSGCAWVTQRDDQDDHFLQAGQALPLQRGAQTLIGAEQDTWLRLEARPGWAAQLWQRLARPAHAGPAATVAG